MNAHDHPPGHSHGSLHPHGIEEPPVAGFSGVPLVELANVSSSYGATLALQDVSLKIWPGQFMAIVGPNGGGKTTLLRTILGAIPAQSGKVLLRGENTAAVGIGTDRLRAAVGNHRLEFSDHRGGSHLHGILYRQPLVSRHRR